MRRDEKTSPRVAKIAAKVLAIKTKTPAVAVTGDGGVSTLIRWSDIRALAASCLTQAPAKPKANKPR